MNAVSAVRADNAVLNQLSVFQSNFHQYGANYPTMLRELWTWVLSFSESISFLFRPKLVRALTRRGGNWVSLARSSTVTSIRGSVCTGTPLRRPRPRRRLPTSSCRPSSSTAPTRAYNTFSISLICVLDTRPSERHKGVWQLCYFNKTPHCRALLRRQNHCARPVPGLCSLARLTSDTF